MKKLTIKEKNKQLIKPKNKSKNKIENKPKKEIFSIEVQADKFNRSKDGAVYYKDIKQVTIDECNKLKDVHLDKWDLLPIYGFFKYSVYDFIKLFKKCKSVPLRWCLFIYTLLPIMLGFLGGFILPWVIPYFTLQQIKRATKNALRYVNKFKIKDNI